MAKTAEPFSKEAQIESLKSQISTSGKPINISFSKTDIREIIRFFSTEFGMNIIGNEEVKGEVSFGFKDIDPIQAFDAILTSQGFDWNVDNKVIHVYTQQPVEILRLNYSLAAEMASPLAQMLSGKGSITVDPASNSLVIKTSQGDMKLSSP